MTQSKEQLVRVPMVEMSQDFAELWEPYRVQLQTTPQTDNPNEVFLYGPIVSESEQAFERSFYGVDCSVSGKSFRDALNAAGHDVLIRCNSPGGDAFERAVIRQAIVQARQEGRNVRATIDGICASAAVDCVLACEYITAIDTACIMLHGLQVFFLAYTRGPVQELERVREEIDSKINLAQEINGTLIDIYTKSSSLSKAEIEEMVRTDSYMSAQTALQNGFVDAILEAPPRKKKSEPEEEDSDNTIERLPFQIAAAVGQDSTRVLSLTSETTEQTMSENVEKQRIEELEAALAAEREKNTSLENKAKEDALALEKEQREHVFLQAENVLGEFAERGQITTAIKDAALNNIKESETPQAVLTFYQQAYKDLPENHAVPTQTEGHGEDLIEEREEVLQKEESPGLKYQKRVVELQKQTENPMSVRDAHQVALSELGAEAYEEYREISNQNLSNLKAPPWSDTPKTSGPA